MKVTSVTMQKAKRKRTRAALPVLNFCLLPFAVCLLPSLRVLGGGEAYARLGGGLFGVEIFFALALRADAEDA